MTEDQEKKRMIIKTIKRIVELSKSIVRLSFFAITSKKIILSKKTQCIISNLEKILILIFKEVKFFEIKKSTKRKSDQVVNVRVEESR